MSVKIALPRVSPEQLRAVIDGRDATVTRQDAIALLAASDFPNKEQALASFLEDETESSRVRALAAASLSVLRTPRAKEVLIKGTGIRDAPVLATVVRALGRIGDRRALNAVLEVKERAGGAVASQARFAAALISHRLGLEGNDLPVPADKDFLSVPADRTLPIQLAGADEREAALCLRSLAREPFGVTVAAESMRRLTCRRRTMMILFAPDFTGPDSVRKLLQRKALAGVTAVKSEEDKSYSTASFVFTSPARQPNAFNILIYHTSGRPAFAGTARVTGKRADFSLRAVSRPGSTPIEIEGIFEDGRLEFNRALAATFIHQRLQPVKGFKPDS